MLTRRAFVGLCGAGLAAATGPRAWADDPPLVVIFSSAASTRSAAVCKGFKAGLGEAMVMSCDLSAEADAGAFIADNLAGVSVGAVFAVGDVALRVALREFNQTPVVWADALDNAAASIYPKARGVSPRLDPTAVLSRLKTLKSDLSVLGVLRSTTDVDPYWEVVSAACQAAGVKLMSPPVSGGADVSNAFKSLIAGAQLTWIQPDAGLWSGAVLASLFHEASLSGHPVMSFDREQMAAVQGPPLVAETDPAAMGAQAAELAKALLAGSPPSELQRYAGPVLVGNMVALRKAGVLVNKKTAAALDLLQ